MTFRGKVRMTHRTRNGKQVWAFRVVDEFGNIYAQDNTADLAKIHDNAERLAKAMNEMTTRGFELKQPKWLREG